MIPRLEELTPRGIGQVVEVDDVLIAKRTAFQDVIVADTPGFGRVLTLDGVVQATDFDSAFYHEPFAHVPLLLGPDGQRLSKRHGAIAVRAHDRRLDGPLGGVRGSRRGSMDRSDVLACGATCRREGMALVVFQPAVHRRVYLPCPHHLLKAGRIFYVGGIWQYVTMLPIYPA